MKSIIIAMFLMVFASLALAEYNDNGKRDPFLPLVSANGDLMNYNTNLKAEDFTLEGVIADSGSNNAAIINGQVVKVNDSLGGYTVSAILVDRVELSKDGAVTTLNIK